MLGEEGLGSSRGCFVMLSMQQSQVLGALKWDEALCKLCLAHLERRKASSRSHPSMT